MIGDSVALLRAILKPLLLYRLSFVALYAALLAPLTGWLMDLLVSSSHGGAVSNYDLLAFCLSFRGVVFLALAGSVSIAMFYAEQAGLCLIGQDGLRGAPVHVLATLRRNLARLPRLTRLGLLQLAGLVALILPFAAVAGAIYVIRLGGRDINYYLAAQPPEWRSTLRMLAVPVAVCGVCVAVLFVRWQFAVLNVLLSDHSPMVAVRESWRMSRGKVWSLAQPYLLWWSGWILGIVLLSWSFVLLADSALEWAGYDLVRLVPVVILGSAAASGLGLAVGLAGTSIHGLLLLRQYHALLGDGNPTEECKDVTPIGGIRRGWIVVIVLGSLILSLGGTLAHVRTLDLDLNVQVTAHRGSSRKAPENTLRAVLQAIEDGADYAEIDVQTTSDAAVVLLHDGDLLRVAKDARKIQDLSLDQLRFMDVGAWFSEEFRGEQISTLDEVIRSVRGRIRLNIELKYNRPDPRLIDRVLDILRREDFDDQCVITSLDYAALLEVESKRPELVTGLIVTAAVGDVTRFKTDFLSVHQSRATRSLIKRAGASGKAVHVWTVNQRDEMISMAGRGVANIITDEPALLVQVLREINELTITEQLALALRVRWLGKS